MRSLALLLALLIALGGASLDLCACAPAGEPVAAMDAALMDEGCCCCAPVPPCCDEPVAPDGPGVEGGCGCGTLELPAPTAETAGVTPSVEAPATVVLALAPAAPSLAELRPVAARALGPPDDPGRRRHLLLHVLRC